MIRVPGAARTTHHNSAGINFVRDPENGTTNLVITMPPADAHVLTLDDEDAKRLQGELIESRSGIVIGDATAE